MTEKRALVTGASGLLGRAVSALFNERGWTVLGTAFSRASDNLEHLDLCNMADVTAIVERFKPSSIIHCAAQRFPDKVEKDFDNTVQLNVEATRHLASIAVEKGISFLYISTDYVFDGASPPYHEDAIPNPLNAYGRTKLLGEEATLSVSSEHLVLRIPILYGPVEYLNESAVTCLFNMLLDKTSTMVSDYEIRYPSHVCDIASVCLQLMELKGKNPEIRGIFHWGGKQAMTKYDMLKVMANVFQIDMSHISPENGPGAGGATRPYNAQLANTKAESLGIGKHTSFSEGIESCLRPWLKQRKN